MSKLIYLHCLVEGWFEKVINNTLKEGQPHPVVVSLF